MDTAYRNKNIVKGSVVDMLSISLTVTQNCNLACKYCYECKNVDSRMSLDTAKKAVDFALSYGEDASGVRFDFMGGEPLLEIDLIDEVCDYIKFKLYEENHKWFGNFEFDLTTNGVLYHTEPVQRFIEKNKNLLSISMTIDGIKEKHDMNRIFTNGEGSFDSVVKNVPLWLEQFPNAGTKVTFASDDLKYIKDSIVFINSLGVKEIVATVVNEDVWKDGDDLIYENQLKELADYMIDNNCPIEFSGGLFSETIGLPYDKNRLKLNWCNCGENNFEVDNQGNLYPCIRLLPFTLDKEARVVGHIDTGVDFNKLRPFEALNFLNQSSQECLNCPVANGCGWCVGNNYNISSTGTIFGRATAICEMHKARSRANDYYFAKLKSKKNFSRKVRNLDRKRFLYILLSDNSVDYCIKNNLKKGNNKITLADFKNGLQYARSNFLTPVVVYEDSKLDPDYENELQYYEVIKIKPLSLAQTEIVNSDIFVINSNEVHNIENKTFRHIILHINKDEVLHLSNLCSKLFDCTTKITLIIDDWRDMVTEDYENYSKALEEVSDVIVDNTKQGKISQLDVISDIMLAEEKVNCGAGDSNILLSPDGEFYPCANFYYSGKYKSLGNLKDGIGNKHTNYKVDNAPLCSRCDINYCRVCIYDNIESTNEYTIPSAEQCKLKNIEKSVSINLQKRLIEIDENTPFKKVILEKREYEDVLDLLVSEKYMLYR
ncbi:radical SAM domain-containing protein [[Clostridium] sordellii]|uniref:radical SAM peptide maturase, CXXX-repeat target family n=1 Tax=Paraclostridium sordellii TaxID=1505 RepID=UPI0005DA7B85|nr:radical SAM peptide maturase, CXXX-repeat target family [Paeniclostridium sordellii]CEN76369.1 radical SAM domain-containing protein [[Clostridium] sordellii] [Paeniclostridium sordellii]